MLQYPHATYVRNEPFVYTHRPQQPQQHPRQQLAVAAVALAVAVAVAVAAVWLPRSRRSPLYATSRHVSHIGIPCLPCHLATACHTLPSLSQIVAPCRSDGASNRGNAGGCTVAIAITVSITLAITCTVARTVARVKACAPPHGPRPHHRAARGWPV